MNRKIWNYTKPSGLNIPNVNWGALSQKKQTESTTDDDCEQNNKVHKTISSSIEDVFQAKNEISGTNIQHAKD